MKLNKDDIRRKHYPTGGLFIVIFLGVVGLVLVLMSGILEVRNYDMLYECVAKNGMAIIVGLFFVFITSYCLVSYFRNVVLEPKKEILFLLRKENRKSIFVNKKGKTFVFESCDKPSDKYYYVMKTHGYIYEVLGESNETFENGRPKEKESYWLNFYSPVEDFKGILLLPVVYLMALPGVLSALMAEGGDKIYGIIISSVPIFMIIYDLICKIKLKEYGYIDHSSITKFFSKLFNIVIVIILSGLALFFITIFCKISDLTSKLLFLPFLICGLCAIGALIASLFKIHKLKKLLSKCYLIVFSLFLFLYSTIFVVGIVKQEGNGLYTLFAVPFYLIGVYIIYGCFKKK